MLDRELSLTHEPEHKLLHLRVDQRHQLVPLGFLHLGPTLQSELEVQRPQYLLGQQGGIPHLAKDKTTVSR